MNKNYYAILMAGGVGSRFWPLSTQDFPKQFHDLLGKGETLLQKTFARLSKAIPQENILILTNAQYKDLVMQQLPNAKLDNILLEPAMRNTAPCILYAALKIQKQNKNAQMVVAPSDHWIEDEENFIKDLISAFKFASLKNSLITLGIIPTFANTGFGYIEFNKQQDDNQFKKVIQFREKPTADTAQQFLNSGNFLWNAGIFIWSATSILDAFIKHQPKMYELFFSGAMFFNTEKEQDFINENYAFAENISIDYAILEKSDNVFVLPANFSWNDLGTWGSLFDKSDKDSNNNAIIMAKAVVENASNNIIKTGKNKKVVVNGLHNFIIVDKDDVLMIYPKEKEQEIKTIASKF